MGRRRRSSSALDRHHWGFFLQNQSFGRKSLWKDIFLFFFLFTLFCLKWSSNRVVQICSSFSLTLSLSLLFIYSQIECCIINNGYEERERKGRRWGCWLFPFFLKVRWRQLFWEKGGGFILHRQAASRPFWLNARRKGKYRKEDAFTEQPIGIPTLFKGHQSDNCFRSRLYF